jgi:prepilin-type N-terminal cleavage/methylation domain-containing protein
LRIVNQLIKWEIYRIRELSIYQSQLTKLYGTIFAQLRVSKFFYQQRKIITMRKDTGFTHLELMVVIGIIGILSAIAIPSYIQWLPKHRVGSAARAVMSAVEFARINAIKTNADVTVIFDWANERLTVESGATTLRTRQMPGDVDLQNIDLVGIPVTINGHVGTPVEFNGHGFSSDAGQVTVVNTKDATISRIINLTLGGNASIQ